MTLERARALDAADPLHRFRAEFALPEGVVYLDGNSLGALPLRSVARVSEVVVREWGGDLIRSWNVNDWIGAPARIGDKIARLIGAEADEVIVADSTSVNIFKLLAAALAARPGRNVILSEPGNFPTDIYMTEGIRRLRPDIELRLVPRDAIAAALDEDVAVLMLTHVHYKTAEMFDMAALTAAAHASGALALWDLSHSAGAVEVDLGGVNADLAVGCGYKYLNGGPGAPAFLYVASRHQASLHSPLPGWMGHAAPFDFIDDYTPADGIGRFLCGTPPILSMAALETGIDLILEANPAALFAKGQALADFFIEQVSKRCRLPLVSPTRGPRGSHVSLRHQHGYAIIQAMIDRGIVGDFRAPDILRFGLAPLYNSFEDVWRAIDILDDIIVDETWRKPKFSSRSRVT